MKNHSLRLFIFIAFCLIQNSALAAPVNAKETIESFYQARLSSGNINTKPPFSKEFATDMAIAKKQCATFPEDDYCGFFGDGDPFLNVEWLEPNSTVNVSEPRLGKVVVVLDHGGKKETITYIMIQERRRWVIDDMYWGEDDGFTARHILKQYTQK